MSWKDFLYFQKIEKLAVILLLILLVLVLILNIMLSQRNLQEVTITQNDSIVREFEEFQQSLRVVQVEEKERRYTDNPYPKASFKSGRSYEKSSSETEKRTYTPSPRQEKLVEGETISLNETDTAQWKKIPGIGNVFADRIVKYRNLLGGFASINQLREVYGMDDELFPRISPYIRPDVNFRKIEINKLEFKELLKHPYLNYEQVKIVSDLRRKKGRIESMSELEMFDQFAPKDIERLAPYVVF